MILRKRIGAFSKKVPAIHKMLVYCVNIFSIEILGWFYRKNVTSSGDFTDFKDFLNLQEEKEYDLNLLSASSIKTFVSI